MVMLTIFMSTGYFLHVNIISRFQGARLKIYRSLYYRGTVQYRSGVWSLLNMHIQHSENKKTSTVSLVALPSYVWPKLLYAHATS